MGKRIAIVFAVVLGVFLVLCIFVIYRNFSNLEKNARGNLSCSQISTPLFSSSNLNVFTKIARTVLFFDDGLVQKIDQISSASRFMPQLRYYLGCDGERTFLVLLQDNAELRPSGGFWGSYGILKVKNAKMTSFVTANSYDLDLENKGKYEAPSSTEGIFENEWRFWNSNWSPDFKISADQGLLFMSKVRPNEKFDGVFGANVDYLLNLLKISGDVKVPDHEFTVNQDNFIQKMIYEPSNTAIYKEKNQDPNLVSQQEKKPLLADLAKNIINQITAQQKEADFAIATYKALNDRNFIIYDFNSNRQEFLNNLNWSGKADQGKNMILITDANIGSKLDFFIEKKAYVKKISNNQYEVTLSYKNTYDTSSKTLPYSIYRDYLRIMVPKGSTLLSYRGGDSQAKMISDEKLNIDAIKSLLIISPSQTKVFTFRYQVPGNYVNQELLVEKQSGSKIIIEN